jgi:hypothetical protein
MKLTHTHIRYFVFLVMLISSCEKEITVDLPPSPEQLVVEASINQAFSNLNYVYITRTIDYFNPDLSLNGVRNALVYITPGSINGKDTTFSTAERVQLFDINNTPLVDSFLRGFSGIYFSPQLQPQIGVPYLLEIEVAGKKITGKTTIPNPITIDTLYYRIEIDKPQGDTNVFVTFEFRDGPEQNNYRLFGYRSRNPFLIGWGSADFSRNFDDQLVNNAVRPYSFFSPFKYSDTLNLYLTSIGRAEYIFWESFETASDNGGPFATPVNVKSNITGAIGSFTGYGISYNRTILR